jgi:hypothetical protein
MQLSLVRRIRTRLFGIPPKRWIWLASFQVQPTFMGNEVREVS